jgi:hypothetical protein
MRRDRRIVGFLAAAVVALGAAASSSAAPALADTATITPASWAYIDSQAPRTSFVDGSGDAPIGTLVDTGNKAHTYRSFFTFDLTQVRGQVVHMANLYSHETAVSDCGVAASVELWQTRPIKTTTTWASPPAELALIQQYNRGAGVLCPGAYLSADLIPLVNAALARRDPSLTVELRITAAQEADPARGRSMARAALGLTTNHAPTVGDLALTGPDRPCGTINRHPSGNDSTNFKAKGSDVDQPSFVTVRFAVWPVADPDQRLEFSGGTYGDGTSIGSTDLSGFPDGAQLAWAAQASDGTDTSAWSRPCYLTLDRTAPANGPAVASALYREGTVATGGPGVTGKFRFDARGDRDVVAFDYRDNSGQSHQVAARRPGGSAVVEYTPTRRGPQTLYVTSIDAAGNRGPTTQYRFWVRDTAPSGQVDVAGVGLPSRITLSSTVARVTEFSYQLPGAAEVRVPATDGTGSAEIVFAATGYYELTLRTYAGTKMLGATTLSVLVSDAPQVESADFNLDHDAFVGQTGTFTFKPRAAGVVGYVYDFGDGQQYLPATADGSAELQWTAEFPNWYQLGVQSVLADGTQSQGTYYQFNVIDTHPSVYSNDLNSWPRRDGVGLPLQIQMDSGLPNLTGFAYRFNGGSEQTVATNGNAYALISVTPEHAGDNTVVVAALLSDGTRSPATTYTFAIWSGPVVTWTPAGSGTVGKPVTFTFHPGLPGVTQYRYTLYGADEQTIPAGPDGTASVTWTPTSWGFSDVLVTSVGADGTVSDERDQYYDVRDNRVGVYSSYSEYSPRGGIGTVAFFSFYTQLFGEVTEYRFHVDSDAEQTIAASTEGTSTYIEITLNRNGLNTLYVQSRTAAGDLSPVTEYRFLVGTAPHVVSAQYPENASSGGGGVPGTFEFSGGTAGITSFDYQVDGGSVATVSADAAGRASVTYTPPNNYEQHSMVVTGHLADGTATDSTTYYFLVGGGA